MSAAISMFIPPLLDSLCYLSMISFELFVLSYKREGISIQVCMWQKCVLSKMTTPTLAVRQMKHAIIPYKSDHFCPWNYCKWKLSFNWLWNISDVAHISWITKYFWLKNRFLTSYMFNKLKCKSWFHYHNKSENIAFRTNRDIGYILLFHYFDLILRLEIFVESYFQG